MRPGRSSLQSADRLRLQMDSEGPDCSQSRTVERDAFAVFTQSPARADMNAILVKKALEKVLNPNILVNLISQRVRQLNSGGGARGSRPLVADTANLGAADVALLEIIEDKIGFDMPEMLEVTRPSGKNRRRPQHWTKS
jgi:DNA-directed RNA polymerase subunit omega